MAFVKKFIKVKKSDNRELCKSYKSVNRGYFKRVAFRSKTKKSFIEWKRIKGASFS